MEPTYKVVGDPGTKPVGLCGSGIIDVISELFMTGIINPKGKFVREGKRVRHDHYGMGSYVIAFGSGINMQNAVNIGMFPDVPLEKFHYIGNSSLTGAYLMLLSTQAEKKTYELAANMTYMELSTVPTYMDEFVGACFIPHTDASMFPNVHQR